MFKDPFDPKSRLGRRCGCGGDHPASEHGRLTAEAVPAGEEARWNRVVDAAVLRGLFPVDAQRRLFLKTVGAATAMAAISSVLPLGAAREAFAQGGAPEKKDLKVGFIPITCATPIIMAHPMGFYSKHGLDVEVVKTAGWAVIRDKSLAKEYDAAHMLSPMPLAISLGVGSNPVPWTMPAIENINGQAITLAMKHKDKRDPKDWKGFKFAVPFDYSMHNYLLRYYVAEHGLDPDKDISIRSVPPPEMVANLRADNIDGFLGPDPFNQRAVYDGIGFIHLLTKELWDGHPCCAFTVSKEFASQNPNAYRALLKAIIEATTFASKAENRKDIAKAIAPQNYLNQPETRARADPDRHLRRRPGGSEEGPQPHRLRPVPVEPVRHLDPDPDEALGAAQGRCRLRQGGVGGLPRHRYRGNDEGDGTDAARSDEEDDRGDGQAVRSRQTRRIRQQLRHQAELIAWRRREIRWDCERRRCRC